MLHLVIIMSIIISTERSQIPLIRCHATLRGVVSFNRVRSFRVPLDTQISLDTGRRLVSLNINSARSQLMGGSCLTLARTGRKGLSAVNLTSVLIDETLVNCESRSNSRFFRGAFTFIEPLDVEKDLLFKQRSKQ